MASRAGRGRDEAGFDPISKAVPAVPALRIDCGGWAKGRGNCCTALRCVVC